MKLRRSYILLSSILLIAVVTSTAQAEQGFGAGTPGGSGKPIVHVTNLNDSGAGSLRAALSAGNRTVVFDLAGEIFLASHLYVNGPFVTVDATTAPPSGITLRNDGLYIRGDHGAHDVIARGIRVRDAVQDGIQVAGAAYNVLIDHCSSQNSGDGNIDITQVGTHDVTVAWSILAQPAGEEKNMLLAFQQTRVTLHHDIFIAARQRNPQVSFDDSPARAQDTDTTLDMRNNIVWDWRGGYGARIRYGGTAHVVANFWGANGGDARTP
jgi:pectate lyase